MSPQPDEVSVEDAYAAALMEVSVLQSRVIQGRALIRKLQREVTSGTPCDCEARNGGADHPAPDFSD